MRRGAASPLTAGSSLHPDPPVADRRPSRAVHRSVTRGGVYRRETAGRMLRVIRKHPTPHGLVRVTFEVPDGGQAVFLVADFNGWNHNATPLRTRSNGTRSVDVTLRPGARVRFRYARPD